MKAFAYLDKFSNAGLLFIRVGLGVMFIFHGFPKLLSGTAEWTSLGQSMKYFGITFLPAVWGFIAAATELLGGILFILGMSFRTVCMLMTFNLIVAALYHFGAGDGLNGASHAVEDGIVFAGFVFIGPGNYSLDHYLKLRRQSRKLVY
jgi:putative oxidoreductase